MAPDNLQQYEIVDLSHDGRGVGRLNGKACFIQGALPGETVLVSRHKSKRNFDEGRVSQIIHPSPDRMEPRCNYFSRCGGCSLQHLVNESQIDIKQSQFLNSLKRGGLVPEAVMPPLSGSEWHYRRRARLAVQHTRDGGCLVGFRNAGSKRLEPISSCEILDQRLAAMMPHLPIWLAAMPKGIKVFELELTAGDNAVAIAVEANRTITEEERQHILTGIDFVESYTQLWWKAESKASFVRLDSGSQDLAFTVGDEIKIQFRPGQFIQVNDVLNQQMIRRVLGLVSGKPRMALDLFCGIGNFSLPLAKICGQVIGVEGLSELVESAIRNTEINKLSNTRFVTADLSKPEVLKQFEKESVDLVVLDPPRSGASGVMSWIAELGASQVVYVSCHPSTMIRDAKSLLDTGYRLSKVGVMDMFPHTTHVEAIALFEK